ncbi:MAG: GUN4 domain-containing protein, partial [Nostoc sp. JL23]|nr:GUN4 domain-containing protein [Nostoc sp. JL23]
MNETLDAQSTSGQRKIHYTNGRFGFSVQKRIHRSLGGTRNYDKKIWEAFADRVGWKKDGEWVLYHVRIITYDKSRDEN